MKAKDLPVFKQKVLDMLPITQVDMWKKLEIDSREGSFIVNIMLKENLLTRKRKDGSFLLEKSNGNIKDINKEVDFELKKKEDADLVLNAELKKKAKADNELKRKADLELKKMIKADDELKRKEDLELKKKAKADDELKRKEDLELKKKAKADDELKRKEDLELKKKAKADDDLKKKADLEIKKKVDDDIKRKEDLELKKKEDFIAKTCDGNTEDINILKQKVLDILPILQADIWKRLDINDCNYLELIDLMVRENLITRTKQGNFFLLEAANGPSYKHATRTDVSTVATGSYVQKRKPKDTSDLRKIILKMLPIAPSDLIEKLDVTNRVLSSTINDMIKENIITRTEVNGRFLLEKVLKGEKKSNINYGATLSSKNRFAPCCGCMLECNAAECMLLTEWLIE
jgi:hypothetical protein